MADHSPGISPDQAAQLKALLDAMSPRSPDWTDGVRAIGDFIGHAGWPIIVLIALFMFRGPIGRIRSLAWKDLKVDIDRELDWAGKRAGEESPEARKGGPTAAELVQSDQVGKLAVGVDLQAIRTTVDSLGAEYERIRATMVPGKTRTQRMTVVVAKMRTLGRAVIPLRHELMGSPNPGQRLAAIASFQVAPDFEALDWLVQRLPTERPFVGYHAAVALHMAARDPRAGSHIQALTAVLAEVEAVQKTLSADTDRNHELQEFEALVGRKDVPSGDGA